MSPRPRVSSNPLFDDLFGVRTFKVPADFDAWVAVVKSANARPDFDAACRELAVFQAAMRELDAEPAAESRMLTAYDFYVRRGATPEEALALLRVSYVIESQKVTTGEDDLKQRFRKALAVEPEAPSMNTEPSK